MGKRSYKELLKESIVQEFDTSKTADVKGPMLDNILSYTGDGELPTHQDAASILERYYGFEGKDKGVNVMEAPQNEIPEVPEDNLNKAKNDIEDEVEPSKTVGDSSAVKINAGPEDIEEGTVEEGIIEEDLENTVLERLISELEEQEEAEPEEEPEEKPEGAEKDAEKLDVDKELKEATGGGSLPGGKTSTGKKLGTSGSYSGDEIEEAFQLFQEQIEDEEDEEDENGDENEEMEESLVVKEQDEENEKEENEENEED